MTISGVIVPLTTVSSVRPEKRREQLVEGERRRVRTLGTPCRDMNLVFHPAHLQAGKILRRADFHLVVGQLAETVFPVAKADHALVVQRCEDLLADVAVKHAVGLLRILEQERDVEGEELRREGRDRGRGHELRSTLPNWTFSTSSRSPPSC